MDERELADHLEGRSDVQDLNGEQTPEEETAVETPAVAETVSEPDPVQQYLAKYDGDTDKALRAAAELNSAYGRQGNELGEIRQQLQQLTQAVAPPQQEFQYEPVTDSLVEWAQEIGVSDNAEQGAMWALQNQPAVYDNIINGWASVDPVAANRFETRLALQSQQYQFQQQLAPTLGPVLQRNLQDQFSEAYINVRREAADLDQYTPQLIGVLEQNRELLAVLESGTPEAKQRIIKNAYLIAKAQGMAPLQSATDQAALDAANGAAALRTQAAVGTTTNSAPPVEADTDDPNYAWRQAFAEEASRL